MAVTTSSVETVYKKLLERFEDRYSIRNLARKGVLRSQGITENSEGLPVVAGYAGGNVEEELRKLQLQIIQLQLTALAREIASRQPS